MPSSTIQAIWGKKDTPSDGGDAEVANCPVNQHERAPPRRQSPVAPAWAPRRRGHIGASSNGRTPDFDPGYESSTLSAPTVTVTGDRHAAWDTSADGRRGPGVHRGHRPGSGVASLTGGSRRSSCQPCGNRTPSPRRWPGPNCWPRCGPSRTRATGTCA